MSAVRILAATLLCLGLLGLASPVLSLQFESPRYEVTIEEPGTDTLPEGASAVHMSTLRADHQFRPADSRTYVSAAETPFQGGYDAEQWAAATRLRTSDYVTIGGSHRPISVEQGYPRRSALGAAPVLFFLTVGAVLTTAGAWIGYAESVAPLTPERALLAPALGLAAFGEIVLLNGVAFRPWGLSPVVTSDVLVLLAGVPFGAALARRRWRWAVPILGGSLIVAYSPVVGFGRSAMPPLWVSLPLLGILWFPFVATGVVLSAPFARLVGPVWGPLANRLGIEWGGPA